MDFRENLVELMVKVPHRSPEDLRARGDNFSIDYEKLYY